MMEQYFNDNTNWFKGKEREVISNCIICNTDMVSKDSFTDKSCDTIKCSKCGFTWQWYQPTQKTLNEFYKSSKPMELWTDIKKSTKETIRQGEKFSFIWDFIYHAGVKSVLDVGCGNGVFLDRLDSNIKRVGIEPNQNSYGKKPYKVYESYQHFVLSLPATDNIINIDRSDNEYQYDMITMFGVLEHLKDPISEVKRYIKFLKKDGYFVVIVPNIDSLIVKTLGNHTSTFCPQHLWYYNASTLSGLLYKCGLDIDHYSTIEPETQPILRHLRGFNAYSDIGIQLTDRDINDDSIIDNALGYKIIGFFKKGK
jgi:2-polyprenyl-3-methyl-5-hydroxy-6-metoxy-1,4-benzoquinol methylase